jgi:thioesterase domain-containing protein
MAPPSGQPRLILLPDISGQMLAFNGLSALLAPHFDVLGVEIPKGLRGVGSFSDLLRGIVRAIRAAQPEGPYRFLGYSYGGTLAAHVAARLEAVGEEIAFLGVLDAAPLGDEITAPESSLPHQRWVNFAQVLSISLTGQLLAQDPKVLETMTDSERARWVRTNLVKHGVHLQGMQDQDLEDLCNTYGQLCALRLPTFPNLECRVVVWRTLNTAEPCAEPRWQDYTLQLDMRLCAGEHHNLLKPPHLGLLAKDILEAMGTGDTA